MKYVRSKEDSLKLGLSFFLWAMSCFRNRKFAICGKTIASVRRNVLSEVMPLLEKMGGQWQEN